jgi:hypothetical protein
MPVISVALSARLNTWISSKKPSNGPSQTLVPAVNAAVLLTLTLAVDVAEPLDSTLGLRKFGDKLRPDGCSRLSAPAISTTCEQLRSPQ